MVMTEEVFDSEECDRIEANLPTMPIPGRGKGPTVRGNYLEQREYESRVAKAKAYVEGYDNENYDDEDYIEEEPTYTRLKRKRAHVSLHNDDRVYNEMVDSMRMNAARGRCRSTGHGVRPRVVVGESSRRTHTTRDCSEDDDDNIGELRSGVEKTHPRIGPLASPMLGIPPHEIDPRAMANKIRLNFTRKNKTQELEAEKQYAGRLQEIGGVRRGPPTVLPRPYKSLERILYEAEYSEEELDPEELHRIEAEIMKIGPIGGTGKEPMTGNYEAHHRSEYEYESRGNEDYMEEEPNYTKSRNVAGGSRRTHTRRDGSEDDDEDIWELRSGVEGGPQKIDLLTGFLGHVAYSIWQGKERGVLKCQSSYVTLALWEPYQQDMKNLIKETGLGHVPFCMHRYIDDALISAFVERWHPETNSFHMPFGEMTITLHDVHYLLRIPVQGKAIVVDETIENAQMRLGCLLNLAPKDVKREWNSGNINFKLIEERLLGADMEKVAATKGYLLWMLGASLFVDRNIRGNSVNASLLPLLSSLKKVGDYAWGAGTLAYLYRSLGIASRSGAIQISGCLSLLQAWIFEYFPILAPNATIPSPWDPTMPYAIRWMTEKKSCLDFELKKYRRLLDNIQMKHVTWTPFGLGVNEDVPISHYHGVLQCRDITEPYMPDRVMRQFGFMQTIPVQPLQPIKVCRSGRINKYVCEFSHGWAQLFRTWEAHLFNFGYISCYHGHSVPTYREWYLERTHPRIGRLIAPMSDIPPLKIDPSVRLNSIGSLIYPLQRSVRDTLTESEFIACLDRLVNHTQDLLPSQHDPGRRRGYT